MWIECVDGFYCTRSHRVIPQDRAPPCRPEDLEPIALPVGELRGVFEGDYLARCLAFARYASTRGQLTQRQRAMFRDDPAAARNMRRVVANLTPEAIEAFQAMSPPPGRHVIHAAAKACHAGDTSAQLRAAAASVGPPGRRRDDE